MQISFFEWQAQADNLVKWQAKAVGRCDLVFGNNQNNYMINDALHICVYCDFIWLSQNLLIGNNEAE